MDWNEARFFLEVGNILVTCAVAVYVWMVNKDRVTNARITALENGVEARLGEMDTRVARVEEWSKDYHGDLVRVHERIDRQSELLHDMVGTLKAMTRQLDMINQHFIDRGK